MVTNSSVGCWINDPMGCLGRTRRFENKHEEEGGVNWKLLPAVLAQGKTPHIYWVIYAPLRGAPRGGSPRPSLQLGAGWHRVDVADLSIDLLVSLDTFSP